MPNLTTLRLIIPLRWIYHGIYEQHETGRAAKKMSLTEPPATRYPIPHSEAGLRANRPLPDYGLPDGTGRGISQVGPPESVSHCVGRSRGRSVAAAENRGVPSAVTDDPWIGAGHWRSPHPTSLIALRLTALLPRKRQPEQAVVGGIAPVRGADSHNEPLKERPFSVRHKVSCQAGLHRRYQLESCLRRGGFPFCQHCLQSAAQAFSSRLEKPPGIRKKGRLTK